MHEEGETMKQRYSEGMRKASTSSGFIGKGAASKRCACATIVHVGALSVFVPKVRRQIHHALFIIYRKGTPKASSANRRRQVRCSEAPEVTSPRTEAKKSYPPRRNARATQEQQAGLAVKTVTLPAGQPHKAQAAVPRVRVCICRDTTRREHVSVEIRCGAH
eukprot:TRINITY_DN7847_c0_g1_i3.p1 TRINITY_DN7847_c0_g1~~TRINITY_DN7847_c0_g1_i3.p1  ORF type:complete len:162 (-),score=3.00 TRINITY_DN7847_c0_g1_i3:235-720(-)